MAKKLRWTFDLLNQVDLRKLDSIELKRGYNFLYHRVNSRIDKLEKFYNETGMESPSLKYVEGRFPKIDNLNPNQLRFQLHKMRRFLNMETFSVQGTKEYFINRKEDIKKIAGDKVNVDDLTPNDISNFYSLFRFAIDRYKDYDSTQNKETVWNVFLEHKNEVTNTEGFRKFIVDALDYERKRIYEENVEDEEDWTELFLSN